MSSRLQDSINDARIQVAKSAIAHPAVYPQWGRLHSAKQNLEKAKQEYDAAKKAWDALIADAPADWKKLAPKV